MCPDMWNLAYYFVYCHVGTKSMGGKKKCNLPLLANLLLWVVNNVFNLGCELIRMLGHG